MHDSSNENNENTEEPTDGAEIEQKRRSSTAVSAQNSDFKWYHWFRSKEFWLYGMVYMSARIYNNVPTVFHILSDWNSNKFAEKRDWCSSTSDTPLISKLTLRAQAHHMHSHLYQWSSSWAAPSLLVNWPKFIKCSEGNRAFSFLCLSKSFVNNRKKVFLIATIFSAIIAVGEFVMSPIASKSRLIIYVDVAFWDESILLRPCCGFGYRPISYVEYFDCLYRNYYKIFKQNSYLR